MSHFPGIYIDFPSYSRSDGSASFGFGTSPQATCSFSGPVEVSQSLESPLLARLEAHVVPLSGIPGIQEKKLAQVVHSIMKQTLMLDKCPRSLVQVVVQEVCDSKVGSRYNRNDDVVLASIINSAMLAAIGASSVPMRGVVCAVAVQMDADGSVLAASFEMNAADDSEAGRSGRSGGGGGIFAFLFMLSKSQCVFSNWHGGSFAQMQEAQKFALTRAKVVREAMHFKVGGISIADDGSDSGGSEAEMEI